MDQMTRYCRDCGADRLFDQPHGEPNDEPSNEHCPDAPGGCPEWACTGCDAALLIGDPGLMAVAGIAARSRVA
ncbi:MAG TPA: hypothetical protein VGI31_00415 [Streptosporangiaceae bacterium]|jgi:hypothetical protein